jgi:5-methylcytosine-specific restriction endonuclease McrA
MIERRCPQQLTWDDFPTRKDAEGWHCRKCGVVLKGRKTAWCGDKCLREVLLLVNWRYIRRCILRRDKYRCRILKADGTHCLQRAREVDHIVELADGGSYSDWNNLRASCEDCHLAKTNKMRTARAAAKKAKTRKVGETPTTQQNPVLQS